MVPKDEASNFGGFFETLDQRLDEFDIRSYGVSMSNLEDVFLKINQEFAPDLFGDLKSFDNSRSSGNISKDSSYDKLRPSSDYAKSIGHSTGVGKSDVERGSQDSGSDSDNNSSASGSNDYEIE